MSKYTLFPKNEHGVSKKVALTQFRYFLKVFKEADLLESHGRQDQIEQIKAGYRWGTMETFALANAARRYPERLGLVDDDGELSYADFWEEVVRLALGLQARGVTEGSNVAVLARNGRASIFPLCARHLLGFHIFMINVNSSATQLESVLDFHEIDTFIVDEEFFDRLTEGTKRRSIILGHVEDPSAEHEFETMQEVIDSARVTDKLPRRPKKGQHVLMTSGTTGMPKGVVRRNLASPQGLATVLSGVGWEPGMTMMLTAVLFHAFGWSNMTMCLTTASTIIARRKFNPAEAMADIKKYNINAMASAASRLRALHTYMDDNNIDHVPGLKFIVSAGSPLTPHEIKKTNEKFGEVLVNFYGSTETACLAVSRPDELSADPTLTGRIYPGEVVEIRDKDGNLVPEGEIGEIWAGCYDMFLGYTDPTIEIPTINGLINMGDSGYITDGDMLHVVGRADDLIITKYAEKIIPGEIEGFLITQPGVRDVYVHGVADAEFGQAIRTYIIREAGSTITAEDIKKAVKDGLSDAHEPRDVFFVDKFPRNPMGKVLKRDLPGKSTVD